MNKDKLAVEFISALSNFSDNELIDLTQLLQTPSSRKAIIGLIRNTVEIRKSLPNKKTNLSKNFNDKDSAFRDTKDHEQQTSQQEFSQDKHDTDRFKNIFFKHLSDRSIYPGTKDVIKTLKSSFNCHVEYETFRKRGRKAALIHCWNHLLKISASERSNLLKSYFNSRPTSDNNLDAYQELFKILTKDE